LLWSHDVAAEDHDIPAKEREGVSHKKG